MTGSREADASHDDLSIDEYDDSDVTASSDEGGAEGGEGEVEGKTQEAHPPAKRRKTGDITGRDILHGPSDGIDAEQDAETNLLQLEVQELLADTVMHDDDIVALHNAIYHIRTTIQALPEARVDTAPVAGLLEDFDFPGSREFTFRPPTTIETVGSFAIHATILPNPVIDLALSMPKSCFDDKDQLNHRYFAKRALYLSHLAAVLHEHADTLGLSAIDWNLFDGDARKPCLMLRLQGGATRCNAVVRLLPAVGRGTFPLPRLAPDRNNLRTVCRPDASADEGPELLPTPEYNSGILGDMLLIEHGRMLKGMAAEVAHFGEAAALLRLWAARHGLCVGEDGVSGFLLTMLLTHVVQTGRASKDMGAMNLFRTTLIVVSNPKTFSNGRVLAMQRSHQASNGDGSAPPTSKAWRAAGYDVIFLDPTGWLNLAANVSAGGLKQAQLCAAQTTKILAASSGPDAFDAVFLVQHTLASLYDVWYRVYIPQSGEAMYARDRPEWRALDRRVADLAVRALGTRATLVRALHRGAEPTSGDVAKRLKGRKGKGKGKAAPAFAPRRSYVLLGARLDPTAALVTVDIGPAADSGAPAADFRSFWGEKAELRRFQDGKIAEATVWDAPISQRHLIVDAVLAHAFRRHLPPGTVFHAASGVADSVLERHNGSPDDDITAARACEAASVRLGKRLRSLDSLTLRVGGITPVAPVLRHADVFPPHPHPLAGAPDNDVVQDNGMRQATVPRCLPAVELLCHLEGSGRWPDDPAAFAKMKAALGVQLAESLQTNFGIDASASEHYVDVFTDGFAFRLLLHTERDDGMQARLLASLPQPQTPPPEADMPLRVWHHGTVSAVAAANPAFEPSVRLAKRWVAAQWLSPHIRDETVELLVAVAFTPGYDVACPPPGSRTSGLLRFLKLLGAHPWGAAPLVAAVAEGDPGPARREAAARAHARSTALPAMFITGPKDDACVGWTRDKPSKAILYRAAVLARKAASHLERLLLAADGPDPSDSLITINALFGHDAGEYDVIIRLRPDALPHADADTFTTAATGSTRSVTRTRVPPKVATADAKRSRAVLSGIPRSIISARGTAAVRRELLVGFDPLPVYVSLLEQRFGDIAVVCADYLGGSAVGLKLRGTARRVGALRPDLAHVVGPATESRDSELLVKLDIEAIVDDAMALGVGLVEKVEYTAGDGGGAVMTANPLYQQETY